MRGLGRNGVRPGIELHRHDDEQDQNRLANIEARFTDAAESAASDLAEIAEETVDTAADVPALAADEVEAVIESPKEPPVIKRKGMLGSMKGRRARR